MYCLHVDIRHIRVQQTGGEKSRAESPSSSAAVAMGTLVVADSGLASHRNGTAADLVLQLLARLIRRDIQVMAGLEAEPEVRRRVA